MNLFISKKRYTDIKQKMESMFFELKAVNFEIHDYEKRVYRLASQALKRVIKDA